jgi:hypothetical protein
VGTLIFALLTAFWAGTSAVFAGMTLITARRDVIVTGRLANGETEPELRRRILIAEWAPLRGALGLVSAMLGIVITVLPSLAEEPNSTFELVCRLASLVPFSGAAFFLIGGVIEYRYLSRWLARTVSKTSGTSA